MCVGSRTRGIIHNKIHLISPGCPLPSIALQVQDRGLKHYSFQPNMPKQCTLDYDTVKSGVMILVIHTVISGIESCGEMTNTTTTMMIKKVISIYVNEFQSFVQLTYMTIT